MSRCRLPPDALCLPLNGRFLPAIQCLGPGDFDRQDDDHFDFDWETCNPDDDDLDDVDDDLDWWVDDEGDDGPSADEWQPTDEGDD